MGEKSRNKTFSTIERKIQQVLQRLKKTHPGNIPVKQVAEECEISRKVFYNHHRSVDEGIIVGEDALVKELKDYIDQRMPSEVSSELTRNRTIFQLMLGFMSQKSIRSEFRIIVEDPANLQLVERMLTIVYPMLSISWFPLSTPPPAIDDGRVQRWIALATKVTCEWGDRTKCDITLSEPYIRQLVNLASNADRMTKL